MLHQRELAREIPDDLKSVSRTLKIPEQACILLEDGASDKASFPGEETNAHVENFIDLLLEVFEELSRATLDMKLHLGEGAR